MPFFEQPLSQRAEVLTSLSTHQDRLVACYCARWCRTCDSYLESFKTLSERFPETVFMWIDSDDEEALLDDLDVENFPTILIQADGENLFFGTMLPYIGHLERLVQSTLGASADNARALTQDDGPRPMRELLEEFEE